MYSSFDQFLDGVGEGRGLKIFLNPVNVISEWSPTAPLAGPPPKQQKNSRCQNKYDFNVHPSRGPPIIRATSIVIRIPLEFLAQSHVWSETTRGSHFDECNRATNPSLDLGVSRLKLQ